MTTQQIVAAIQKLADKAEPEIARAFLKAVQAIKAAATASKIEAALRRGGVAAAVQAVPLTGLSVEFQAEVRKRLLELIREVGKAVPLPGSMTMDFNVTNPAVLRYLESSPVHMIREITTESREAIRAALTRSFVEGMHPYEMGRSIRQYIGLTRNQAATVARYREYFEQLQAKLTTVKPAALTQEALQKLKRGRMIQAQRLIIRQGLTDERVNKLVENYTSKLLRERAALIARTLVIDASNAGQNLLWGQAVEKGLLEANEWKVKWITAESERSCRRCVAMDDQTRLINGKYENGSARPPLHPSCRCSEGLVRVKGAKLTLTAVEIAKRGK